MLVVENTIISDDIADNFFVCNVQKCKGACCVEGDLGAPLEHHELDVMDQVFDVVQHYMNEKGLKAVHDQGVYVFDEDRDYSTPTVDGKECAYGFYDEHGFLKCAIEQAWLDKKIDFRKPLSCHLYPIRITKYDDYDALNYDRWDICSDACSNGKQLKVPLYKFLKEALIRKYGKPWYKKLEQEIKLKNAGS